MPQFLVETPDGKKFQIDAPEGATQEQALAHFRSQYEGGSSNALTGSGAPEDTRGEFTKGVASGTLNMQGMAYGFAGLLGDSVGSDAMRDWGLANYQAKSEEAQKSAPKVGSYTEIEDFGDFMDFTAGVLGQTAPFSLTTIAGGGMGGLLAKAIAPRMILKGIGEEATRAAVKRILKDKAYTKALGKISNRSMLAGSAGASAVVQQGGLYGELKEAGVEDAVLPAWIGGAIQGSLDVVPEAFLFGKIFGKAKVGGELNEAIARGIGPAAKRIAKGTAQQTALEGATEGMQEVTALIARASSDPAFDWNSDESHQRVLDSIVAGGVAGLFMGAGGNAIGELVGKKEATGGKAGGSGAVGGGAGVGGAGGAAAAAPLATGGVDGTAAAQPVDRVGDSGVAVAGSAGGVGSPVPPAAPVGGDVRTPAAATPQAAPQATPQAAPEPVSGPAAGQAPARDELGAIPQTLTAIRQGQAEAAAAQQAAQGQPPAAAPATAAPAASQAASTPTAEPIGDIRNQLRDVRNPRQPRRAVFLSADNLAVHGDAIAPQARGLVAVENADGKGGTLYAKLEDARAYRQRREAGEDPEALIGEFTGADPLGLGGKPDTAAPVVIQQKTPDGAVTRETVADGTDAAQVTAAAAALEAPGREVTASTVPQALERRDQGVQRPPPWEDDPPLTAEIADLDREIAQAIADSRMAGHISGLQRMRDELQDEARAAAPAAPAGPAPTVSDGSTNPAAAFTTMTPLNLGKWLRFNGGMLIDQSNDSAPAVANRLEFFTWLNEKASAAHKSAYRKWRADLDSYDEFDMDVDGLSMNAADATLAKQVMAEIPSAFRAEAKAWMSKPGNLTKLRAKTSWPFARKVREVLNASAGKAAAEVYTTAKANEAKRNKRAKAIGDAQIAAAEAAEDGSALPVDEIGEEEALGSQLTGWEDNVPAMYIGAGGNSADGVVHGQRTFVRPRTDEKTGVRTKGHTKRVTAQAWTGPDAEQKALQAAASRQVEDPDATYLAQELSDGEAEGFGLPGGGWYVLAYPHISAETYNSKSQGGKRTAASLTRGTIANGINRFNGLSEEQKTPQPGTPVYGVHFTVTKNGEASSPVTILSEEIVDLGMTLQPQLRNDTNTNLKHRLEQAFRVGLAAIIDSEVKGRRLSVTGLAPGSRGLSGMTILRQGGRRGPQILLKDAVGGGKSGPKLLRSGVYTTSTARGRTKFDQTLRGNQIFRVQSEEDVAALKSNLADTEAELEKVELEIDTLESKPRLGVRQQARLDALLQQQEDLQEEQAAIIQDIENASVDIEANTGRTIDDAGPAFDKGSSAAQTMIFDEEQEQFVPYALTEDGQIEEVAIESGPDTRQFEDVSVQNRRSVSDIESQDQVGGSDKRKGSSAIGTVGANRSATGDVAADSRVYISMLGETLNDVVDRFVRTIDNMLKIKGTMVVVNSLADALRVGRARGWDLTLIQRSFERLEQKRSFGVRIRIAPGQNMIVMTDKDAGTPKWFKTLAHEVGHVYFDEAWAGASTAMRTKLTEAYNAWVADHPDIMAKGVKFGQVYSLREWMSDQTAAWVFSDNKPRTAVEKFLYQIGVTLKQVYDYLVAKGLAPDETAQEFIRQTTGNINSSRVGDSLDDAVSELNASLQSLGVGGSVDFDMNIGPIEPQAWARQLWNGVRALRAKYPSLNSFAEVMTGSLQKAHEVFTSRVFMRVQRMNIPAYDKIMRAFYRQVGVNDTSADASTFFTDRDGWIAKFGGMYRDLTRDWDHRRKTELMNIAMREEPISPFSPYRDELTALREMFAEMRAYMRAAGLPIGDVRHYFPAVFNLEALNDPNAAQEIYEQLIRDNVMNPVAGVGQQARHYTLEEIVSLLEGMRDQSYTSPTDPAFNVPEIGNTAPWAQALAHRKLPDAVRNSIRAITDTDGTPKYMSKDMDHVITTYIDQSVTRAEYNRRMGDPTFITDAEAQPEDTPQEEQREFDPHKRLKALLEEARVESGATEEQRAFMHDVVSAMLGQYQRIQSPAVRKLSNAMMLYQNTRTLLFTVFSSIPDMANIFLRGGDFGRTWKVIRENAGASWRGELNGMLRSYGHAADMADSMLMRDIVNNRDNIKYVKWNETFFKYTGLTKWTTFTRGLAAKVAEDYILQHGNLAAAGNEDSIRRLAELGVTWEHVAEWQPGQTKFTTPLAGEGTIRVTAAMQQMINDMVIHPTPPEKTLWGSDERMKLMWHLKSFMYGFSTRVLGRAWHEIQLNGWTSPQAIHSILALSLLIPLAAFGLFLRDIAQYWLWGEESYTPYDDPAKYLWVLAGRSGITGMGQMAIDTVQASQKGRAPLLALAGPTITQLNDFLEYPLYKTVPGAIPIISNIPGVRNELRDILKPGSPAE